MLKNHVKLAWRNLAKYPGHTLLNLGGLALGIAAAFVLGLYVRQELTYDAHFADGDRIYRVATDFFDMGGFANSQAQLLDVLPQETPVIEAATRLQRAAPMPLFVEGQRYEEPNAFYADSAFFQVFAYRFVAGDAAQALQAPDALVLTEHLATKLFGERSALGQVVLVGKDRTPYRVSGVVASPPGKTHLPVHLWLPLVPPAPSSAWSSASFYNYVRLRPDATQADLARGLENVLRHHAYPASGFSGSFEAWKATQFAVRFFVQPLHDIYLHSDYNFELAPGGNPTQVYALGLVALFILLIAGVNYVNLTTARSAVRAKEVGVKKTMGAERRALVGQFLTEAVVFSLIAAVLAALLAEAMAAVFALVTGAPLIESVFADGRYLPALLGFALGVGVLAGLYPAIYLSGFRPVKILKGEWTVAGNGRLRGVLVVLQFAIAIVLVVGSLVVYRQLAFMQRADKGLRQDGVLIVENVSVLGEQAEAFRQQLEQLPQVARTSFAAHVPTARGIWRYTYKTPEMEESITIQTFPGDENYLPVLGMRLLAGRNFSGDLASDSSAAIVNEAAARALGLGEDPLGKEINEGQSVIGIVDDFNFQSMRQRIEPVVIAYTEEKRQLAVQLHGHGVADFLDRMQALWQPLAPDDPIAYSFIDDNFARMAEQERVLAKAVSFFTILALAIAAMGLFGLTAFAVQRRTKEIGIRKVLGASLVNLVGLISVEFLRLVAVAFVVAAPLAYVAASRWLDGFAYRIDLGLSVFVLAGVLAVAVALLTVSYHAVRAALADPVKSLRYE